MEKRRRGRPKLHAEITETYAPSRRQAVNALYLYEAAYAFSVAATEIPNHQLLWYSDPAKMVAGGKHGIMEQLGRMLLQDHLSDQDFVMVANMAADAIKAGRKSREVEKAIRKFRMAVKRYEADEDKDFTPINAAVSELRQMSEDKK